MANRMFKPLGGSLTQEIVCLTGKWTFGGSGAIASSDTTGFSVGVATAAGRQAITLDDRYNSIAGMVLTYEDPVHAADETAGFEIRTETVSTNRIITVQHFAANDGDEADLDKLNGKTVHCMIWLKNSSV